MSYTQIIISQLAVCALFWLLSLAFIFVSARNLLRDHGMKRVKAEIISQTKLGRKKIFRCYHYLYGYRFKGRAFASMGHKKKRMKTKHTDTYIYVDKEMPELIITRSQHFHSLFNLFVGIALLPIPYIYALL